MGDRQEKYGLLIPSTRNLGDDIQTLAAMQYLPRVDLMIDRDSLSLTTMEVNNIKVIMNGWFTHNPGAWPPDPRIDPLFVSFHLNPRVAKMLLARDANVKYLQHFAPIGCRDIHTVKLLRQKGIESNFTGCLSLTLDYKYKFSSSERKTIVIVDLTEDLLKRLPRKILQEAAYLTHIILRSHTINERIAAALTALRYYATAKLVLTSRLHAALPALAYNTPVIFVHHNLTDPRFSGLLKFLNHYNVTEFSRTANKIDWEDPPENPNTKECVRMKRKLIRVCKTFIRNSERARELLRKYFKRNF